MNRVWFCQINVMLVEIYAVECLFSVVLNCLLCKLFHNISDKHKHQALIIMYKACRHISNLPPTSIFFFFFFLHFMHYPSSGHA